MKLRAHKLHILFFAVILCSLNLYAQQNNQEEKKAETKKNVIPEYEHILDSSSSLHMFTFKDENLEHLVLHQLKTSAQRSLIQTSKNKTKRYFYGDDLRLFCVENWMIGKKVSESYLEKITYYFYGDENSRTQYSNKKFDMESKEYNIKNNVITQIYYENGHIIEKNQYFIVGVTDEDKLSLTSTYKEIPFSIRREYSFFYSYDSAGQVIAEEEIHNEFRNNTTLRVDKTSVRKNIYEYLNADCPPVTTFYENNILRMKTIYSSEKDYVQNVYFDDNNYVKVQIKDGKKVSEIFYLDGKAYEQ